MTIPTTLLHRIRRVACQQGTFHLPTGEMIEEYFDEYLLAADPALLRDVANHMSPHVPPRTEALAGLELGGIPLVIALSAATGVPAAFVRRQRKPYGTCRQLEGQPVAGRNVALVDDVIRSGSQVSRAASVIRRLNGRVTAALCVLDRCVGAGARLAQDDIALRSLLTATDLTPERTRSTS